MTVKAWRAAIAIACAAALPSQALAASQCMSSAEAQSVMAFALPDVLESAVSKCRAYVAEDAYIAKAGGDMILKYRTASTNSWPQTKAAFLKMAGSDSPALKILPDNILKGVITAGITSSVANDVKPESCGKVDRLMSAIAPLPPENTAMLVALLMEMSGNKQASRGFTICQDAPPTKPATK